MVNQPLGAFRDVYRYRNLAGLTSIVALYNHRYFCVAKAVRSVESRDVFIVFALERFAIAAMTQVKRSGLDKHPLPNGRCAEVFIAGDGHVDDLKPFSARDDILNRFPIVYKRLHAEVHVGVVISLALEVILEITFAFDQQIVIDAPFLKDRHISFQHAFRYLGLNGLDFDSGALANVKVGAHEAVRGIVVRTRWSAKGEPSVTLYMYGQTCG